MPKHVGARPPVGRLDVHDGRARAAGFKNAQPSQPLGVRFICHVATCLHPRCDDFVLNLAYMRKLWFAFAAVVVLSFAVLGWTGIRIYQQALPVPTRVVTADGRQIFAAGAVALAIFVIGLRTGGSTRRQRLHVGEPASVTGQS